MKSALVLLIVFTLKAFSCNTLLMSTKRAEDFAKFDFIHKDLREVKRQGISNGIAKDLELEEYILPLLLKHSSTRLGKHFIKSQLYTPLIDSNEIIRRQRAVEYIQNNPAFMEELQNMFNHIARFEMNMNTVTAKGTYNIGFLPNLFMDIFTMLPYVLLTLGGSSMDLITTLGIIGGINLFPGIIKAQDRDLINAHKALFSGADSLAPLLKQADSENLKYIGQILSQVRNKNGDFVMDDLRKKLSWEPPPRVARATDFLGLTGPQRSLTLRKIEQKFKQTQVIISALMELEMFLTLAKFGNSHSAYSLPKVLPDSNPFYVSMQNMHHPYALAKYEKSVDNNFLAIKQPDNQQKSLFFLTGPNARGKSVYIKSIGINLVLAQMGAPVPAQMTFSPTLIFSNIKNTDNMEDKASTFRQESKRMSLLIRTRNQARELGFQNALFIMDEIFVGTTNQEALAIEESTMKYLIEQGDFALVASHKRELVELAQKYPQFQNIHASDNDEMLFKIEEGPSQRINAVEVLEEEQMPKEITSYAREILKKDNQK